MKARREIADYIKNKRTEESKNQGRLMQHRGGSLQSSATLSPTLDSCFGAWE